MKFTRRGFLSVLPVLGVGAGKESSPRFTLPTFEEWHSMSRGDRWNWHIANGKLVPLIGWRGESLFANKKEVESVSVSGVVLEIFLPELQKIHESELIKSKRSGVKVTWEKGSKSLGELYDDPYWPGHWAVKLDQRKHWKDWFNNRNKCEFV